MVVSAPQRPRDGTAPRHGRARSFRRVIQWIVRGPPEAGAASSGDPDMHPFIRHPFIGATTALTVLAGALFINEGPAGASGAATPKLVWADCGDGLQCATARVPLDHDHPNGKKISLAVIRRPAT